jgi:transposase
MGEHMNRPNLRSYTPEFRAEAVKLVLEQGLSIEEAAQHLSIPKGTLSNWAVAAKRGTTAVSVPGSRSVTELEAEVARLRKLLAQFGMRAPMSRKGNCHDKAYVSYYTSPV